MKSEQKENEMPNADLDIKHSITTREFFSLKGILVIAVFSISMP